MEAMMTLTGYAGHNIELRHTKTGIPTCTLRVGTTPRFRTEQGWTDGATTWVSVVCYRSLAEYVARSVDKVVTAEIVGPVNQELARYDAALTGLDKVIAS